MKYGEMFVERAVKNAKQEVHFKVPLLSAPFLPYCEAVPSRKQTALVLNVFFF